MQVIVSAAVSLDGFMDDTSPGRLVLSSAGDLTEVHRLRAGCDAIMVGARTVRNDNPSLIARISPPAYPIKVTLTASGDLPRDSRFFADGAQEKLVYVAASGVSAAASLSDIATLVPFDGTISALVADLQQRGIRRLMVEGGADLIHAFFQEKMVDMLRLSIAPRFIGANGAARFTGFPQPSDAALVDVSRPDGMLALTYEFR